MTDIIKQLADQGIHCYGSDELLKFERQMEQYFTREYKRWSGNDELPENYGISSFHGDMTSKEIDDKSIEHYNKELDVYRAFLDKDYMAYTMAYYGASEDTEIDSALTLEQAQRDKYKLLVERAEIKDGHNILDLGCGFGGFVKYLLQTFPNVTVTGINPSSQQTKYIRNSLKIDNSRFRLVPKYIADANEADLPHTSYDRIVSIGTLEHFSNLDLLFKYLATILKPGGKCLHHIIVSADTIPQFISAESTLISDYFPGGHIWPYAELKRHDTHLMFLNSWFVNGKNYWKTLDEWHKRFWLSIEQLHPHVLSVKEVEHWNKYFSLCKTMFSPNNGCSYGNGHYLYEKR